ncbi:helix-turn-helix transcriptional regulator [Paenibacillus ginsengarvi]|nr:AraC family transcriptional regulator [Paenibacillus ginsengarvi]
MKPRIDRPNFRCNQFYFLHKEWQNVPVQHYHAHEGIEFLYIHEGSGRLILDDRLYTLGPRALVFFQPYQPHLLSYELPYLRSLVKFKLPLSDPFIQLFPRLCDFFGVLEKSVAKQQIFQLDPKQDKELSGHLALLDEALRAVTLHEQKEQFHVFLLQFMSFLKLRIFIEVDTVARPFPLRHAHYPEKVWEWVNLHFKEPFHLNKLALDLHLSASYLSGLFRQYTGSTITEYITKRRLDEACLLLQTTSLPIDQVGKNSGFRNAAYFCRSFKKRYGLTPQQYRIQSAQSFESFMPSTR